MKNIFAPIYETWFSIYEPNYRLLFDTLYNGNGYIYLGLSFIIIPLICWYLFYYTWKFPYGNFLHWLLWMLIAVVIVFASTWSIANSEIFASNNQKLIEALNDPETGYKEYATSLPTMYGSINSLMALLLGFIFALFMKRYSKVQTHLPF